MSAERSTLGGLDCVRFVIEALRVGWDRDFSKGIRYSCRRSAVSQLRQSGGLYESFCEVFGTDIPITDLTEGDIAYFVAPHPSVGLVMPDYIALKTAKTILRIPMELSRSGWKTDGSSISRCR